ncbi:hypothetical protein RRSWK_02340 [Rhodopirellula sp. SWK7]|nr:hypothetical protein RRSWK_02340 [Rhodopirellula sp. SWK7]
MDTYVFKSCLALVHRAECIGQSASGKADAMRGLGKRKVMNARCMRC